MTTNKSKKIPGKGKEFEIEESDYSLNEVALRGWVTTIATERELPSGDAVVQFRIYSEILLLVAVIPICDYVMKLNVACCKIKEKQY